MIGHYVARESTVGGGPIVIGLGLRGGSGRPHGVYVLVQGRSVIGHYSAVAALDFFVTPVIWRMKSTSSCL
jgi:hypothetical protein